MLKAEEEGQNHRHAVVEAEERWHLVRLLHEGKVGSEEEGVVIVADETLPGRESPLHTLKPVTEGPPGSLLGGNLRRALILIHGVR